MIYGAIVDQRRSRLHRQGCGHLADVRRAVGVAAGAVLYGTVGEILRNETGDEPGVLVVPIVIGAGVGPVIPTGGWKKIYDSRR